MEFTIPRPLKIEHEELHAELAAATKLTGPIGEAARLVAKTLHPHFLKEEEFALPALGLLPLLAKGEILPEMKNALAMTERLKVEVVEMIAEHKAIVATLEKLKDAARKERKTEYERFADKLMLHAQTEEEVLYPTAILIGEYLKLKLNQ